MDYGKFKYQEQKKAAEAKSKQKVIEVKEVKFRPGTDEGDYNIKMRNLRRFIAEDGDKGKVTLRFRGREITHQDIGMRCSSASATSWPTWRWSSTCPSSKAAR
jgi:translation initiation factor IF-3